MIKSVKMSRTNSEGSAVSRKFDVNHALNILKMYDLGHQVSWKLEVKYEYVNGSIRIKKQPKSDIKDSE